MLIELRHTERSYSSYCTWRSSPGRSWQRHITKERVRSSLFAQSGLRTEQASETTSSMQVASARADKHMSRFTARVAWKRMCSGVLPFLQSRGLKWRSTTSSHAARTPFTSQAFRDGRMSRRKHILISPRPPNHQPASQSSHGQGAGASMLQCRITSSSSLEADRPASLRRAG